MTEALLERPRARRGEPTMAHGFGDAGCAGLLQVDAVSAWLGSRKVLDRVSLTMAPRQVTALVGVPGVGKSTFLQVLSRRHELVGGARLAGAVRLDGFDVYDADRTLAEERDEIRLVRPDQGSDVRQRLDAIVSATFPTPRVLLLDEPAAGLDAVSVRAVEELLRELAGEVTIVLATSDARHAARVADRIAHLVAEPGSAAVIVDGGATRAPARAGSQHLPGPV